MEASIFLARFLWPLFIVISLSIIINGNTFDHIIKEFPKNSYVLYLSGLMAYVMGALMLLNYNSWALNWFIIITIMWYLALIKWILILLFPERMINMAKWMKFSRWLLIFVGIIYFILGAYLCFLGF
ncbi:MAG: hypothetical protein ACD_49C00077G0029 [uncultured bacterium (gcode 4)]|uniref:Uncharacterized protein n=1 Tax=uncultured bacterium (gcode 4) TaxID=1234023 RepID=K2AW20_9BACT|nr:MAG: hypothetical protein ACD_49C00077G0029 [uncultured bacterium (gcode 4)]